jgi:tetratricopeptide (TPR) repeat protein
VWPDKALGERIAKDFIAILVDVDKDEATAKQYGVSAMPTLVIADNKEKTLVKQVGAPFSTAADAAKWFENISSALKDVSDLEAKHAKDAKDVDVSLKLAETYLKLSRLADAAKLLEEVLAALPKDDKRVLDVKLKLADALLKGDDDKDSERGVALCKELTEAFVKAKDERAMESVHGVMMGHWKAGEFKEAREALLTCVGLFPKHDKAIEYRVYAAYLSAQTGDKDTARKELKAVVEAGPADHQWVETAKKVLEGLDGEGK